MTCLVQDERTETYQYVSGHDYDGNAFYDFAQEPVWVSFCGKEAHPGEMEEYLTDKVDCPVCLDLCPLALLGELP